MNKLLEKIIDLMMRNRTARLMMVVPSHFWFFHCYFRRGLKYPTADFQKEMIRLTEDDRITNLVFAGFRGSAKSTIVTLSYAIWAILGRQQKKFILIIGQTEDKAREHLENIKRQLEENALLKNDLGPFQEKRNEWGTESLILTRYGARIAARSIGQSIRGKLYDHHRPDVIILDDIESTESVKSKDARNKIDEWAATELIPAGDLGTRLFLLGTPLHPDSFLMRVKKEIDEGRFAGLVKNYPFFDEAGMPLWPGKFPDQETVDALRKSILHETAWRREFLLETVSEENRIIDPNWIQYYDAIPREIESTYRYTVLSIDPAVSEHDAASCTAMIAAHVYGSGEDTSIYILPTMVNAHFGYEEMKEKAKFLSQTLGKGARAKIIVEDVGAQRYLVQDLVSAGYAAKGVIPHGGKDDRLMVAGGKIQAKKVFFPRTAEKSKLIEQLVWFLQMERRDLADALSQLIIEVTSGEKEKDPGGAFGYYKAWYEEMTGQGPSQPKGLADWVRRAEQQRRKNDQWPFN